MSALDNERSRRTAFARNPYDRSKEGTTVKTKDIVAGSLRAGDISGGRTITDVSPPFHGKILIQWEDDMVSCWRVQDNVEVEVQEPDYEEALRSIYPVCMGAMLGSRAVVDAILRANHIDPATFQ